MSRSARPSPRRASGTAFSGSSMSFFMAPPWPGASVEQVGHALDKLPKQGLQRALFFRIAQHGNLQGKDLAAGRGAVAGEGAPRGPRRMGQRVGLEKDLSLLRREVTDLDDGRHVPGGD